MNKSLLDDFCTKNLRVEIITPVNIASGTKLTAKEYLYDSQKGKVYFINQALWHNFIVERGLFDDYEKYILVGRGQTLYEWLHSKGYKLEDVRHMIKNTAKVDRALKRNKRSLNDIVWQTRTVMGEIYIPGSSIKGAVKTAIMFSLLQKNVDVKRKYWPLFVSCEMKSEELRKKVGQLEAELLNKLRLQNDEGKSISSSNMVCSAMRGICISDVICQRETTAVLQKIDLTFDQFGREKKNEISLFRECLLPGTKGDFSIKIDNAMTELLGIKTVHDVLRMLDDFFVFTNDLLRAAFDEKNTGVFDCIAKGNVYLGGGTGFLTKTLLAAMAPRREDAVNAIKRLLNKNFPKARHLTKDKFISPRTLKLTSYNGQLQLMGIARIYIP